MQRKVYTIGATTFDILFKENKPVESRVGGSTLNTSISLARLGIPVSFITEFGYDKIGDISYNFIRENGISTDSIQRFEGLSRVALAFLDEQNNANYNIYRATGQSKEWQVPKIRANDIFLFGSSFAVKEENRCPLKSLLNEAKKQKAWIMYDPNFRESNASGQKATQQYIRENFSLADIVKGSDEDFRNIFGASNSGETWEAIQAFNISCLVYTANKDGVHVHQGQEKYFYPVPKIQPVSTIGAGDNFSAGLIYGFYKNQLNLDDMGKISKKTWDDIIGQAIRFAQHVCMSYDNYLSGEYAKNFTIL
jgi:fructokinase